MVKYLIGESGSGKDWLKKKLIADGYIPLITCTTRPMREGEKNGVDYFFITKDDFFQKICDEKIYEYRSYNTNVEGRPDTWYYGSLKYDLDPAKNYVAIGDIDGALAFLNEYGTDNVSIVRMLVPDSVREDRAKLRGSFDKTEWDRRLLDDKEKFSSERLDQVKSKLGRELEYFKNY